FGITVPLQLFDRNQGDISAARHRLAQTEQQKRTAEIRVHAALSDAYSALA
ncbi:MAG: TolC family protein, partial [Nitrospinaceae bacterium]|nr:TolC family protein [Nitrospinaceae bacterium]NIS86068.1 TolC family protein [Nitrospinaceae bacterium]NIT82911.1 TolC family protein [Nitrospinaceae bacterium]NIU45116.1 TolC family protein [Nitrospinaceae bacterium]NIU97292.1 TolC family protein [Nitrospinaceae bacterium]